jgi:hypothetical protein
VQDAETPVPLLRFVNLPVDSHAEVSHDEQTISRSALAPWQRIEARSMAAIHLPRGYE